MISRFLPAAALFSVMAIVVRQPAEAAAPIDEELDEELEEEFEIVEQSAEVVFSAARHEQKIGFSPAAVVVITRKEIEASGAASLSELLRRWPVTNVYEYDPLVPIIDVRNNIRVLLLVDGREVNLDFFMMPFYATLPIGLQEIERIEIVLGPSSAVYGANAVSAVINVITRRPTSETGAEASLAAGEHGGLEMDLRATGSRGPLALRLSGGVSRADYWMQPGRQAKDIWRFDGRAAIELGEVQVNLDGGFSRTEGKTFGVLGYINLLDIWMSHADALLEYKNLRLHSYWYGLRGGLGVDASLYYPDLDVELGLIPTIQTTGDTVHNEAQLNLEPITGNLLVLGADIRYTRFHSPQFVDDTASETRAGIYFHDEQLVSERWMLQAGLRYDWNSRTDWALSPRGAVIFNPVGEHYFRLSGGMAFRKPSLMETSMNFEVDANPAFPEIKDLFEKYGLSNPDLGNELLSSVELGWKSAWLEGRLRVSLDAYAAFNRHIIGFENKAVFEETPLGPRLNLEKSRIGYEDIDQDSDNFGAHANLEARPLEWLVLFLRAEIRFCYFTERANYRKSPWFPNYIIAAGATFEDLLGLHGQAVFMSVGATEDSLRHPESIFLPLLRIRTNSFQYLMLYLGREFEAGPLKFDAGISFFNLFNRRFREDGGVIDRNGIDFGGEMLSRRFTLLVRAVY